MRWNNLAPGDLGLMNRLHSAIAGSARQDPSRLPQPFMGESLYVASDYGATHGAAPYDWIGLLITDMRQCESWLQKRAEIRRVGLPDGRRISYKTLGDSKRSQILAPFLRAADHIQGLLVLIYFERKIKSLFRQEGYLDLSDPSMAPLSSWKHPQAEKLLRIIHFILFFAAALSQPGQHLVWITDEDEIVPNERRMRDLIELTMRVASHYVPHTLGYLRFATAGVEDESRFIEDLVSLPDLAGGGLAAAFDEMRRTDQLPRGDLIVPLPSRLSAKALLLSHWFADYSRPLKRMIWRIDTVPDSTSLALSEVRFAPFSTAA